MQPMAESITRLSSSLLMLMSMRKCMAGGVLHITLHIRQLLPCRLGFQRRLLRRHRCCRRLHDTNLHRRRRRRHLLCALVLQATT